MDFRHLIVTCLFSKLRLPFDNQKVKENYAIFFRITRDLRKKEIRTKVQKKGGAKNHSPLLPTRQTTKIIAI